MEKLDTLFTRDEALAGQPLKQARPLLFLIEARTAQGMARSAEQSSEVPMSRTEAAQLDQDFWEAFALARNLPIHPAIQDLERFVAEWAAHVPESPTQRAALAHLLGQKYVFTRELVPGLRAALGCDQPAVQQAYSRLFRAPLASIYKQRVSSLDRLRWFLSSFARWAESLPPFWIVFFLTLTRTIGVALLALPIAVARVGPLVGVGFVIVLGLLNVLTTIAYGNASVRCGTVRFRRHFFGRMVADYLGERMYRVFMGVLLLRTILTLLTLYLAISTTLADVVPVPAAAWVGVLLFGGLYMVWRQSFRATLSFALVVGVVTVCLILGLVILSMMHVQGENLLYVHVYSPQTGGFDPALVRLVFGVILTAFSGHGAINNSARVLLRRDPSGRAVIWGAATAQFCVMVLYIPWILAINGTIPPSVLAAQSETVLAPLATWLGPGVLAIGAAFAVLSLGLKSIYSSLALARQVRTLLPTRLRQVLLMFPRGGQIIGRPRSGRSGGLLVGAVYLGLVDGRPAFRVEAQFEGHVRRRQIAPPVGTPIAPFDWLPELHRQAAQLSMVVLDADAEGATVQVDSLMQLTYQGEWWAAGLRTAALLDLSKAQRQLLPWMLRQREVGMAEIVAHMGGGERSVRYLVESLLNAGLIHTVERQGRVTYQVTLASRRASRLPEHIWQRIGPDAPAPLPAVPRAAPRGLGGLRRRAQGVLLSRYGSQAVAWGAVVAVGVLTAGLLLAGRDSFAETVSFTGLLFTFQAGILPVFLFIASQHKGEWPEGIGLRVLTRPVVTAGIYLIFLASFFLHGLLIWQDPWLRAAALLAGTGVLVLSILIQRQIMAPRIIIELRRKDGGESGALSAMADGQLMPGEALLKYAGTEQRVALPRAEIPDWPHLRQVVLDLPAGRMQELKVWVHQETPAGNLEPIAARVEVRCGEWEVESDPQLSDGQIVVPLPGPMCQVRMTLVEEGAP